MVDEAVYVFSELEMFRASGMWFNEGDCLVQLLRQSSSTLKEVHCTLVDPRSLSTSQTIEVFAREAFPNLQRLYLDICLDGDLHEALRWFPLLDILEERSEAPKQLKEFSLHFVGLRIHQLKNFLTPNTRGWQLVRRLLSPASAPALQELYLDVLWNQIGEGDQSGLSLGSKVESALRRCCPQWEGDGRRLSIIAKMESGSESDPEVFDYE